MFYSSVLIIVTISVSLAFASRVVVITSQQRELGFELDDADQYFGIVSKVGNPMTAVPTSARLPWLQFEEHILEELKNEERIVGITIKRTNPGSGDIILLIPEAFTRKLHLQRDLTAAECVKISEKTTLKLDVEDPSRRGSKIVGRPDATIVRLRGTFGWRLEVDDVYAVRGYTFYDLWANKDWSKDDLFYIFKTEG